MPSASTLGLAKNQRAFSQSDLTAFMSLARRRRPRDRARANFGGLVLGGIEAKFCNKICVGKHSPRSTQCAPLHSSAISIFCQIVSKSFVKISKNCKFVANSTRRLEKFENESLLWIRRIAVHHILRQSTEISKLMKFQKDVPRHATPTIYPEIYVKK